MVHYLRLELYKVFEFIAVEKPTTSFRFQSFQNHGLKCLDLTHRITGGTKHPLRLDLIQDVEEKTRDLSLR
jgi:hypothetical protein